MGTWEELKRLVKDYLDSSGKTIDRFNDNMPGRDWLNAFLERHKDQLTVRAANMLKRSRGNVSREDVQEFFDRFSRTVQGVEAKNIYNYDETNFRDDPGAKRAIFKKGCKYVELSPQQRLQIM